MTISTGQPIIKADLESLWAPVATQKSLQYLKRSENQITFDMSGVHTDFATNPAAKAYWVPAQDSRIVGITLQLAGLGLATSPGSVTFRFSTASQGVLDTITDSVSNLATTRDTFDTRYTQNKIIIIQAGDTFLTEITGVTILDASTELAKCQVTIHYVCEWSDY